MILVNFGTLSGAQIFDHGYLGHFLSDGHKILHGYGSFIHLFQILCIGRFYQVLPKG